MIGSGEHFFGSSRLRLVGGLLGVALLCLATVPALRAAPAGAAVEPRIVERPGFSVIGIQARTSNAREVTGGGAIPKQWDKFFKEGIAQKIPNKVDSTIYAVYTNTPATTTANTISSLG